MSRKFPEYQEGSKGLQWRLRGLFQKSQRGSEEYLEISGVFQVVFISLEACLQRNPIEFQVHRGTPLKWPLMPMKLMAISGLISGAFHKVGLRGFHEVK